VSGARGAAPPGPVVSRRDDRARAVIVRRTPLRYAGGPDPALDRPGHVRAGSGLAPVGARLAVVQDDAHFLALVEPASGVAHAVTLPAGPGGARQFDASRGTKHLKLDLESCVALPAAGGAIALVAFGSGSTSARERVLVATFAYPDEEEPAVRLVEATPLYAALRAESAFAGSEMNVEGAAVVGDRVRLFGRGNGAARDGVAATNATCDVDAAALLAFLRGDGPPPAVRDVRGYALDALDGCPLGFTDAAALDDGRVLYTAAAEASPNAVDDGEVAGSAIGWIAPDGASATWTPLRDADGTPCRDKVEGVVPARPDGTRLWVVTDADDPEAPSALCEVVVETEG
jgi:hypothetical protein